MEIKLLDFIQLDSSRLIDEAAKTFKDSVSKGGKRKLELITDATHSGKVINDRVYRGVHVKDGAKTFFKSEGGANFDKPFLKNHDTDLDPIGRVVKAEYHATLVGSQWTNDHVEPSVSGSGFLRTTSHIMDDDSIEKFLDGRFQTVSQSAVTDALYCSKCTKDKGDLVPLFSEWVNSDETVTKCDHYPGDMCDGEKNYLISGKMFYKELSQVNNPADDGGIHVGMQIIQDHLKDSDSFFSIMGSRLTSIDVIRTPVFGRIVDSNGAFIKSLNSQDYVPTKTISIPEKTLIEDKSNKELSDSEFAEARILDHFAKYHGITLSAEDTIKVEKIKSSKLTKDQKDKLEVGFYLSPSLPFSVLDQAHGLESLKLADKLFKDESKKEKFINSIKLQADKESIQLTTTEGTTTMDEKQAKALLESLDALKLQVEAQAKELEDLKTERDGLVAKVVDENIAKLIKDRASLGYLDCKDFESKSDEDKKVVLDKYKKMSSDTLDILCQEAKDNLEAGNVLGVKLQDTLTTNPLTTAAPTTPVTTPVITPVADSKKAPKQVTSLI